MLLTVRSRVTLSMQAASPHRAFFTGRALLALRVLNVYAFRSGGFCHGLGAAACAQASLRRSRELP